MGVGEDGGGGAGERTQKPRCTSCEQFVRPYSSRCCCCLNISLFTVHRVFVTLYFKNRCRVNCFYPRSVVRKYPPEEGGCAGNLGILSQHVVSFSLILSVIYISSK